MSTMQAVFVMLAVGEIVGNRQDVVQKALEELVDGEICHGA